MWLVILGVIIGFLTPVKLMTVADIAEIPTSSDVNFLQEEETSGFRVNKTVSELTTVVPSTRNSITQTPLVTQYPVTSSPPAQHLGSDLEDDNAYEVTYDYESSETEEGLFTVEGISEPSTTGKDDDFHNPGLYPHRITSLQQGKEDYLFLEESTQGTATVYLYPHHSSDRQEDNTDHNDHEASGKENGLAHVEGSSELSASGQEEEGSAENDHNDISRLYPHPLSRSTEMPISTSTLGSKEDNLFTEEPTKGTTTAAVHEEGSSGTNFSLGLPHSPSENHSLPSTGLQKGDFFPNLSNGSKPSISPSSNTSLDHNPRSSLVVSTSPSNGPSLDLEEEEYIIVPRSTSTSELKSSSTESLLSNHLPTPNPLHTTRFSKDRPTQPITTEPTTANSPTSSISVLFLSEMEGSGSELPSASPEKEEYSKEVPTEDQTVQTRSRLGLKVPIPSGSAPDVEESLEQSSSAGSSKHAWMIILVCIAGVSVMVTVAITTRDRWMRPKHTSKRKQDTEASSDVQPGAQEMEEFLHKDKTFEHFSSEEYTIIPLEELSEQLPLN